MVGHHCESVQGGDMEERGRKVYVLGREADLKDVRVVRNRLTCMGGLLVQSKEMSGPSLLLRSKSWSKAPDHPWGPVLMSVTPPVMQRPVVWPPPGAMCPGPCCHGSYAELSALPCHLGPWHIWAQAAAKDHVLVHACHGWGLC